MERQRSGHRELEKISVIGVFGALAVSGLLTVAVKAKGYMDRRAQNRRNAEAYADAAAEHIDSISNTKD